MEKVKIGIFFKESDDDIAATPFYGSIEDAMIECPKLNANEAFNWGNSDEEEPIQSREALDDAQFKATIARHSNNDGCIQLLEDDRTFILIKIFLFWEQLIFHPPCRSALPTAATPSLLLAPHRFIHLYKPELKESKMAKRAEEAANFQGYVEPVIVANPTIADVIICEDNHHWKILSIYLCALVACLLVLFLALMLQFLQLWLAVLLLYFVAA
ncbi:hypothetical protein LguiA_021886 [Lonicera macranthoides]